MKRKRLPRTVLAVMLVLMVAVAPVAGAVADDLNFGGDNPAPNPYIDVDTLTISKHPMAEGTSHEAMAGYYDDDGDWIADPAFVINTTHDIEDGTNVNPYTFKPGHIEDPDFGAFPRRGNDEDDSDTDAPASEDNLASALDASEWSKSGANSSKLTISDTTVAQNVDAVRFSTSGMANGDVAVGTYSNWSAELDSDENKRFLQVAADVDTLSGTVEIRVTDESGDYKTVHLNSSKTASGNAEVLADGTGDSFVTQVQMSDLTTVGGGSWDNIESIKVNATDGDVDVSFSWIDLEKKSEDTLGIKRATTDDDGNDDDSDSEWDETQEITAAQGEISVRDMDSLGSAFDDATITNVKVPAQFRAQDLTGAEDAEGDYYLEATNASDSYPGFHKLVNVTYRMVLPAKIDLSYSGLSLELDQQYPTDRYVTLGINEGIGEKTDLTDSDTTYTDNTGTLSGEGEEDLVLDSTVSSDTYYGVKFELKVTENEWSDMNQATSDSDDSEGSGAAVAVGGDGVSGAINWVWTLAGGLVAALGVWKRKAIGAVLGLGG